MKMKKYILSISAVGILFTSMLLTSCDKNKVDLAPTETYRLIGKIDPSRTTIATATLTKAEFTIVYNSGNSFGEAQSVFSGNLTLAGYTGITGRDTLAFFSTQASGPAISYITAANASIGTTNTNNVYNYFNGAAATFNATNYPFTNEITATLKEGKGYFRIGQFPKYVFVLLDNVTKL
jgi:hypothetical protein